MKFRSASDQEMVRLNSEEFSRLINAVINDNNCVNKENPYFALAQHNDIPSNDSNNDFDCN
ncbi:MULTISPECIES: hypothetical protein [Cysteiniphilum]|uniref:hypothetical protein n=1 Tax=Cysteiniphilum TaxID=2056696 RepID=UPI001781E2AE|nr:MULTISPECIES: hypothetical protein [Cysteiniphilum]